MLIIITVVSILGISGAAWLVNRILPFTICPTCAGVFITWVWLVSAHFVGYQIDLTIPALLMGGSVVGSAHQLEKKFSGQSVGVLLLWKVFFIPSGFVAAYGILEQAWTVFLSSIALMFLISVALLFANGALGSYGKSTGSLEKKMEECC